MHSTFMLKKWCLSLFLLSLVVPVSSAEEFIVPENLEEAIAALDDALDNRQRYINRRVARIDSLCSEAEKASETEQMELYQRIGDEYRGYNVDSAICYYNLGRHVAIQNRDTLAIVRYKLLCSALMPIVGVMKEEIEFFDSINVEKLPKDMVPLYYSVGSQLFFYVTQFYVQFPELQKKHAYRGLENNDSAYKYLDPQSPMALLYQAQSQFMNRQTTLAVATLNDILEKTPPDNNVYARAANILANVYKERDKKREHMYYLALSALSDIWSATLEETSLMELGVALYTTGDVYRAYTYITASINNAVACGAKMRALQASQALPYIVQGYKEKEATARQINLWFVFLLIVAVVALAWVVLLLRRDMSRLRLLKSRLTEANNAKEAYNGQFLNLASIYMDKLEEFNRFAGRKIAAKQVDELYSFVKSGKIMEAQSRMFYEVFDKAFVHTYPTFVDDVNRLLLPDKQTSLPEGALLNTELRIVAFMRLGVEDSNQIARFLNLSLNTIYTYRNKLKSRAISRETFEADIMKIGKID